MQELNVQPTPVASESKKSRRGFASMDKGRHKLVSSKGGRSLREKSNRGLNPLGEDRKEFN